MLKFCLINLQEKLLVAKLLYARNVSAAVGAPQSSEWQIYVGEPHMPAIFAFGEP
jgi:hypothetical protein